MTHDADWKTRQVRSQLIWADMKHQREAMDYLFANTTLHRYDTPLYRPGGDAVDLGRLRQATRTEPLSTRVLINLAAELAGAGSASGPNRFVLYDAIARLDEMNFRAMLQAIRLARA